MTTVLDADQFTAYLTMQGHADATIRNYRAMYVRWTDWTVTNRHPHIPQPTTARDWSRTISGSRSLLAHARATIGHLCRAYNADDCSPAIPLPRQQRQHKPALTDTQTAALLATAEHAGIAGLAVKVGLYTAARRSEIASLAWRRVDFAGRQVTLERTKTRDLHTVPMHPRLEAALRARWTPGELWVFPGRHGGHVTATTVWQWVLEVSAAAEVGRVTPHQLRRTALTHANDATGDLRAVQELAGHTDPSVTARYTRASERRMRAAVGALDWSGPEVA